MVCLLINSLIFFIWGGKSVCVGGGEIWGETMSLDIVRCDKQIHVIIFHIYLQYEISFEICKKKIVLEKGEADIVIESFQYEI